MGVRNKAFGAGLVAVMLAGVALVVSAQGPSPSERSDGGVSWPGGPMTGMFQFGGVMGGFAGKVITGKPVLATLTITRVQTLPGNIITSTSTGTFARSADGSIYRDIKFAAIGPWAVSGKAREFAYIRNVTQGMQYVVNVTKGTYSAFPIRDHKPRPDAKKEGPTNSNSGNETVTHDPDGTYTDHGTNTSYSVDAQKVTRTIPAGAIGNEFPIVITSERKYSNTMELLLEDKRNDPRFGTTTYQLSNIGHSPAASLFTPDPSFTQVQGGGYGPNRPRGRDKQPPPPPQS